MTSIDDKGSPMLSRLIAVLALWMGCAVSVGAAAPAGLTDNGDSIAIVVGNRDYRQATPVDYAHNDAGAIREFLVGRLGFRDSNVFLLKDATLNELNQMFGTDRNPQAGRLWRSVAEGRSNVFVYFSGHGIPDFQSRKAFLLPHDGDPNQSESSYGLETLYRNLDLVKRKVGPDRQVIVMIDACFTGETGRKGESLLAVSAPGFAPAKPKAPDGVVKLAATSGATPANWDPQAKLGLFTSRVLMGASGLADGAAGSAPDGLVSWDELRSYVGDAVSAAARRESGREQQPEIDAAPIVLAATAPVEAVAESVAAARDEAAWRAASAAGTREALEAYVGSCGSRCGYRQEAMARLFEDRRSAQSLRDAEAWRRLSDAGRYDEYLKTCAPICGYRALAEGYLGRIDPAGDPDAARCDDLAAAPNDPDKPADVTGVSLPRIEARAAIAACSAAVKAHPGERRFAYQLGRAYDRADRYRDAFAAYSKAVEAGGVAAMNNLATLHENGQGVALSLPKAYALYRRAAEAGNVLAMSNVARMTEYGRGVRKNETEAVAWHRRAAEAGDVASIVKLVPHYFAGTAGLPKAPQKGMDLFRQAAAKGDPSAKTVMATLIDNGFAAYFPGETSLDLLLGALASGEAGSAAISGTDGGAQKLKPATIRALQQRLTREQHYSGAVDGRFNPIFVRALDSYARSKAQEAPDGDQAGAAR
ncbi:caspase family protein [Methylopila musalis]|uniref:Caspase family protein n=1 Tax=Methylopila musalis TaxID=1134781 RepID=A0ABW3ZCM0_9HYPH